MSLEYERGWCIPAAALSFVLGLAVPAPRVWSNSVHLGEVEGANTFCNFLNSITNRHGRSKSTSLVAHFRLNLFSPLNKQVGEM